MIQTVGTCSICGGPVHAPIVYYSLALTCAYCGAVSQQYYGPIIKMQPPINRLADWPFTT